MKKFKSIAVAILLASFISCGESETKEVKDINGTPKQITVEEKAVVDSITTTLEKSAEELEKETEELKELVNDI